MKRKHYFWLATFLFSYFLVTQIIYWWQKDARWDAVPKNAAIILDLKENTSVEAALGNIASIFPLQQLEKELTLLDSIGVNRKNTLAVLQASTPETFNWLFIFETDKKLLQLAQKRHQSIRTSTLYDTPVHEVIDTFALAQYENIALLARYPLQVERSIEQLINQTSLWKNRNLRKLNKLENLAGLSCYISLQRLPDFLAAYVHPNRRELVQSLVKLRDWVRLDIQHDSIETRVRGQWLAEEKSLQNFAQNVKNEAKILNILPDNTAFYTWGNLSKLLKTEQLQLPQIGKLWEQMDKEAAIAFTESYAEKELPTALLMLRLKHEGAAIEYLQELSQVGNVKSEDYQMFQIFEVNDGTYSHFVQLQDYLIFSQKRGDLATYLDKYIAGQVLANDIDFLRSTAEQAGQSTAAFYFHTQRILPFLQNLFKDAYQKPIRQNIRALQETKGLHLSFGISAKLNGKITQPENLDYTSIAWRTSLDTVAASAPQLLTFEAKKRILIQDELQQLYCLDEAGAILWKKQLKSPILSDFQAIDFYDNEQTQYLFNTTEAIHLVDENGTAVGAFPMKLQSAATNGLRVVDFDGTGFRHFFVACENGNIYGFDQNGRPLEYWSPRQIGLVLHPIEHFQWEQKDYILILDQIGKLHVLQRDANERFLAQTVIHPRNSTLAYQANTDSPRIIVADTTGLVRVLHPRGDAFNLPLAVGNNQNVQFIFSDIWGDERKDYITLSKRQLAIYAYDEQGFKKRFGGKFEYAQDAIFSVVYQGKNRIGMLNQEQEQLVLFNAQQRPKKGFPLAGTTAFFVDDLFGQEEQILVAGNRASVVAYRVFE